MNVERLLALRQHLDGMTPRKVLINDERRSCWRTNDPTGEYVRRDEGLTRSMLKQIIAQTSTQLNLTLGIRSNADMRIGGIAAITVQRFPTAATEAYEGRTMYYNAKISLVLVAAGVLGLNNAEMHALLRGPNFAGDLAAWITPQEAGEAIAELLAKRENIWNGIDRQMLHLLEQGVATAGRSRAMAVARDDEIVQSDRARRKPDGMTTDAEERDANEKRHPNTVVALSVEIAASAVVGDGTVISGEAKIGKNVAIGERASIRSHAVIESQAIIGNDARVGMNARVKREAVVGGEARVGDGAELGERGVLGGKARIEAGAVLAEDVSVGDGSVIGARSKLDRRARIGDQVLVGELVTIGEGVTIERNAVIGQKAEITLTEIHEGRWVPANAKITNAVESERYAVATVSA